MDCADDLAKGAEAPERRTGRAARLALFGAGAAALVAVGTSVEISSIQAWVAAQGPLAPIAFILIGAILSLVCVPLDVLAVVGGVLFDFVAGLLCVTIASSLGQCLAYAVARATMHERVGTFLAVRPRLKLVERALAARGAFLLFLIRLAPIPAAPTSYLVGATRMPFSSFAIANLGLVPVSFLSLSLSRSLLTAGEGAAMDPLLIAGIVMAAIALVVASVLVKRSLRAISPASA